MCLCASALKQQNMQRKEFIKTCGLGCLSMMGAFTLLESCAGVKYLDGTLVGSSLNIPLQEFQIQKQEEVRYRSYVVVQNNALQYPICVYRLSETEYQALLMKCTHQGTELQVFGDRLQCPAHGSEFTKSGAVQNGPAEADLRTFPVQIEQQTLKINLT